MRDHDPAARPLPLTPPDAVGSLLREQVFVEGRAYLLQRPADSDRLIDHPAVRDAFAADDYLPYWADLWPAARMLAKALVREPWPAEALAPATRWHALEVGCGLGLPGVVALSLGLRVTFSDYDATALQFAAHNARLNGYADFDLLTMDWRDPPRGVKFRLILASDLIYEMRNVAPLVGLIAALLAPDGECLLTDQDRVPSHVLRGALTARGLPFTTQVLRAGEPGGRRLKGTLYRIRLPGDPAVPPSPA
jgi:predicted nicotinamide N-methyase